jgi:hypothetical protein
MIANARVDAFRSQEADPARSIFLSISSVVRTSANTTPKVAQVARCTSAAVKSPMPPVAVASHRKKTRKSRTFASRAVVSQHTLVAIPTVAAFSTKAAH